MLIKSAKFTSKGQITVPKEVRESLGVQEGDKVYFKELPEGGSFSIPFGTRRAHPILYSQGGKTGGETLSFQTRSKRYEGTSGFLDQKARRCKSGSGEESKRNEGQLNRKLSCLMSTAGFG
ncbi:AbrB/MazE/SpoVT family DNA-binding domain-containing protein [Kroppenstedtia eburnea]|uniref:AbrB/MazE/SpoVT family DNA-binding domain-containing protein n=1 Tax=Kroppenstedtia eburnea TaxID=714067 RepID=UPI00363ED383